MEEAISDLILFDVVATVLLIFFYFVKPKEINPLWGYRTPRSMKNQKNWKFAQDYSFKKLLYFLPIMYVNHVWLFFDLSYAKEIVIINGLLALLHTIGVIIMTEKKLKNMD